MISDFADAELQKAMAVAPAFKDSLIVDAERICARLLRQGRLEAEEGAREVLDMIRSKGLPPCKS